MSENEKNRISLGEAISSSISGMSRAERRITRVLSGSGFEAASASVAALAEKAGVSGPSVLRFTAGLGFASYPEFQKAAAEQQKNRVESPSTLYERARIRSQDADLASVSKSILKCLESTFDNTDTGELDKIAKILGDARRNIYTIGGQTSGAFADALATRLFPLRPGVFSIGTNPFGYRPENQLAFMGRRDVIVAFDFRRYQESTVFFAKAANARGSTVVLLTDTWLSPIADFAQHVLTIDPDGDWPADFYTPCLALVEVLQAIVLSKLDPITAQQRIQRCERYESGLLGAPTPNASSDQQEGESR